VVDEWCMRRCGPLPHVNTVRAPMPAHAVSTDAAWPHSGKLDTIAPLYPGSDHGGSKAVISPAPALALATASSSSPAAALTLATRRDDAARPRRLLAAANDDDTTRREDDEAVAPPSEADAPFTSEETSARGAIGSPREEEAPARPVRRPTATIRGSCTLLRHAIVNERGVAKGRLSSVARDCCER
jgi:hypothetical protein